MELTGEHTFNVPREKVWKFMLDPEVLKACLPGCEKLEAVGEDEYVATMKIQPKIMPSIGAMTMNAQTITRPFIWKLMIRAFQPKDTSAAPAKPPTSA